MAVDWDSVRDDAVRAAKQALGGGWNAVSGGVTAQIAALVGLANYIEDHRASISDAEYSMLMQHQKLCLQGVLTGYKQISYAVAKNVVSQVVNVLLEAIPGLLGLAA